MTWGRLVVMSVAPVASLPTGPVGGVPRPPELLRTHRFVLTFALLRQCPLPLG